MPVLIDRQPSAARAHIERVARFVDLHPTAARAISRFALAKAEGCTLKFIFARDVNVDSKKHRYGAEVTDIATAKKWITAGLKPDDFDKVNNCIIKSGMILMHYTPDAYEVREMVPMILAMKSASIEIDNFNNSKQSEARILDENGRLPQRDMRPKNTIEHRGGRSVRKMPGKVTQDDILEAAIRKSHEYNEDVVNNGVREPGMPRIIGEDVVADDSQDEE